MRAFHFNSEKFIFNLKLVGPENFLIFTSNSLCMETILITGASSGIGKATAQALDHKSRRFILCGRREDRLKELAKSLKADATILAFDIRKQEEVNQAFFSIQDQLSEVTLLVNNAGGAHGLEALVDASMEDVETMIDSNLKGLLYVSKRIIPFLINNKKGHIINISSIAGKETYARGMVYCASKSAVESISKGMRLELNPHGVRVTNIAPGAVETEFSMVRFKGNQEKADQVYKGFKALTAEDIAETIRFAYESPAHVQIADLLVLPTAQASATQISRKHES